MRLHAIKGDVQTHLNTRYYELQQVVADTTDDPFAPVTEEIRARQKQVDAETATLEQLKSVAKLEKAPGAETCGEAEKWLVARILNYYDDHFAGSDGKLDPTVRALFLCETGFKQRGDVAYPIDTSSAFWPDELRLIKSQARIVDAKFLLKQHGKVSYLDTLETMEADIKTSGFTGILLECKQNQLEQHAKRIGKIMRIRAVEPSGNHSLSDALFALSLYSAKKDLVGVEGDEKATAAANLCNEVCDVLLSRTTDLHSKKQSLVALTSSKRYQCLKTSRTVGRQFLNQLWGKALFFLAAVKWVITGSYHWRTDGASKRKNLEIAVANNSFSVMETIQTNKQPVGVNALAAAA